MEAELQALNSFTGLLLMFVLGLRHGLDPDHIACIDGLTWRALHHHRKEAVWIGTLFAIGHGLLVTAIAAGVSQVTHKVDVPETVIAVLNWVPTALLLLVGTLNLRLLLVSKQAYQPTGWKLRLIPARLRNHNSPFAVIAIGVLFATVFDTATQASAWGYVASNKGGGLLAAVAAGLTFTVGMIITDTLDGRLICHVNRSSNAAQVGPKYRRVLGWLIVSISYGVASYNILSALLPEIELDDKAFSLTGASLIAVMALLWGWLHHLHLRRAGVLPARSST
ncbi:hypothetical protein A9Y76_10810 [Ralstonia insidiosa]|jgi:nickel/cobalt transporter (NiCoT) family protein|uniref:Nickel/cobalt efflux system n=2 Tax=Ralstonia TaxID=48736 RepID=A0A191ZXM9_9RALS|nr:MULTISPECIES: hypothetical protein [Ralstonia]ANJ72925.1 hypothetical protein A9Y76_10810 [Ralstonia insidiosa]EPX97114.1 hypothetical protein C404_14975 [Ralstonia sp. AU12-08]MBT2177864.1 hypothetical protein [Ralstonia pickettii]CAJ0723048.1 hypothetical protein R38712_01592 [Ralstonia pickettii]